MLLNEDYFNDIKISEDDIESVSQPADILSDDRHMLVAPDYNTLKQKIAKTGYDKAICITTNFIQRLYDDRPDLWKDSIPNMLKKIEYILGLYSADYKILFYGGSFGANESNSVFYKIEGFPVLFDSPVFSDTRNTARYMKMLNVLFFVRMPKLTYRQSYYFIDRMLKMLSSDKLYNNLAVITEYSPLTYISEHGDNCYVDLSTTIKKNYDLINPVLPYKTFFREAVSCFSSLDVEDDVIRGMFHEIIDGRDPLRKD